MILQQEITQEYLYSKMSQYGTIRKYQNYAQEINSFLLINTE